MPHRALVLLAAGAFSIVSDSAAPAQETGACERGDLKCWQALHASECTRAAATIEACLVFLQRLETARRGAYSSGMTLLLGETLHAVARMDLPPQAKERYLARSRAAYRAVVDREPFDASGYLGLAELAETGEERVEWLRGAVQAGFRPAHLELLANALSKDVGGQAADLEAARFIEDAYTYEVTDTEKWRYAASAWRRYAEALDRYPGAASQRSLDNVVLRVKDDVDYLLLQRTLLAPESHLTYLADAFATMCEESIADIVSLDECMAGLERSVAMAEGSVSAGARRLLAEAVLTGMRTIAGESVPKSAEAYRKFPEWIDRLLMSEPEPVDVSADLLEARADFTADLPERAGALLAAIELSQNRGDLRLKLGATYVNLRLWPEALEQLRVAKFFLPIEAHEPIDRLVETADKAYQAGFFPAGATTTERGTGSAP